MKYIELFSTPDRLGGNITMYIAQIFYAHHNKYYIKYDAAKLKYRSSCFVTYLCSLVDTYNTQWKEPLTEPVPFIKGNWSKQIGEVTRLIQADYVSWFRHLFGVTDLSKLARPDYTIPFDARKTILVHLRLDDVANLPEYDGTRSSEYYRNVINTTTEIIHVNSKELPNHQSPLHTDTLIQRINLVKESYPHHEVILITSPNSIVKDLPYRVIQSPDENHDLFLLSACDVIILSRSTFSLASLFFGNHAEIHMPLIGFLVVFGHSTLYDKSKIVYF